MGPLKLMRETVLREARTSSANRPRHGFGMRQVLGSKMIDPSPVEFPYPAARPGWLRSAADRHAPTIALARWPRVCGLVPPQAGGAGRNASKHGAAYCARQITIANRSTILSLRYLQRWPLRAPRTSDITALLLDGLAACKSVAPPNTAGLSRSDSLGHVGECEASSAIRPYATVLFIEMSSGFTIPATVSWRSCS